MPPAFAISTYSSDADAPPVTTSAMTAPVDGGQPTAASRARDPQRHRRHADDPEQAEREDKDSQDRPPGTLHRDLPAGLWAGRRTVAAATSRPLICGFTRTHPIVENRREHVQTPSTAARLARPIH